MSDYSPPGSSVHGIFQARILEWVAIPFFRGSSQPRDRTCVSCVSCIVRQILYHCATREAHAVIKGTPNLSGLRKHLFLILIRSLLKVKREILLGRGISENWALAVKCFCVQAVILAHTSLVRKHFLYLPHFKRAGKYDSIVGLSKGEWFKCLLQFPCVVTTRIHPHFSTATHTSLNILRFFHLLNVYLCQVQFCSV